MPTTLSWSGRVFTATTYGVPKAQVMQALRQGQDVILKIDVQGAATVREIAPDAVFIFLAPPSEDELERRLIGRRSESDATFRHSH